MFIVLKTCVDNLVRKENRKVILLLTAHIETRSGTLWKFIR